MTTRILIAVDYRFSLSDSFLGVQTLKQRGVPLCFPVSEAVINKVKDCLTAKEEKKSPGGRTGGGGCKCAQSVVRATFLSVSISVSLAGSLGGTAGGFFF